MAQLEVLDPKIAEELKQRYATKFVYKTAAVAAVFEEMQAELLRAGSRAQISALAFGVKAEGYEFGIITRRKRQPSRRVPIAGSEE